MKKLFTLLALTSFSTFFSQITINANLPSSIGAGSTVETDVKIIKGAVGNFAKYQMDVPTGYVVSVLDAKGGNFTFENQRAKIVWVSVPSDPEFTVKLKVQASSNAANPGTFSQKFYYLENNEKKEVEAAPIVISLGGGSSAVTATPVETKPVETTPVPVETKVAEIKPVETTPVPVETKVTETKPVEVKVVETKTVAKTSATAEAGMTFKVQVGAFATQPNKSKYNGLTNVSIDLINGMYKVTAGKFNSKEEAIKYRDEIQSKGFSGFIAKYKDGVRIN